MGNVVTKEKSGIHKGTALPDKSTDITGLHSSDITQLNSNGGDDQRPIPINEMDDGKGGNHTVSVALEDVLGPEDSTTARYRKKNSIGKGAFGEAYIVERNPAYPLPKRRETTDEKEVFREKRRAGDSEPRLFVAKVMDLTSMSPNDRRYAQTEIMCLACNHHFAIIQYYEHFIVDDEDETIVIITEFADQGDLYRNLYRRDKDSFLSERDVGMYFVQLLLGLDHIHRRRMIHRDIKTANIFLTSRGFLKLGDFGFSQQYDSTVSNPIACTFLGTSYYLSPEMWKGQRYGKKADIWASGIVLCELLGKRRPFEADSLPQMKELVLSGRMWLPPTYPDGKHPLPGEGEGENKSDVNNKKVCYVSKEMREFLELILQQDPEKRPSASQLLKTPLMQHYLCLFRKRVEHMIAMDDELEKKYQTCLAEFTHSTPNYCLSMEEEALVLRGILEGEEVISLETERELSTSAAPRMESVVYKESVAGQWKERYLLLGDGYLTMTLAKGKAAAGSGERSKKVPLETINAVAPVLFDTPVQVEGSGGAQPILLQYAFAISTQNSQSIMFAARTQQERDQWLASLLAALKMD
ncbi:protein kinase [Trypanosoma theileri]|uniref:non-specific serine/threonine protein kinase n=1 Tax=Trypanosoma theileri TaxID=67003 RepID=A0A1X0NUB2_9TRYP|nr:protein kinase [Trypanosoma theileri]ORC88296.1 protein kinase [Trypanosoma theileri]